MLKKAVVGLFVIIALTLVALFGVSIAAGTALKEVRVYPLSNVVLALAPHSRLTEDCHRSRTSPAKS